MHPAVSIVYATYRGEPLFGWFVDALVRQLERDHVEIILVDGLASADRRASFETEAAGRIEFVYAPAKPTVFNGTHQRTRRPMFAAASARNTGITYTSYPYVAFVDDCSLPMPGWWAAVREAARHQYVVAGAYQRHADMEVVDGVLRSSRVLPSGTDTRWALGDDRRVVPIAGGQVYTASVGVPRDALVEVNGFDELCDGVGGEDCNLGIRLELAGHPIFYSRSMLIVQSEDQRLRSSVPFERFDPVLDDVSYLDRLARFGVSNRTIEGRCDASHMVLDLVYGLRASRAVGNSYDLASLRPDDLASTANDLPTTFWFDGRPFRDL